MDDSACQMLPAVRKCCFPLEWASPGLALGEVPGGLSVNQVTVSPYPRGQHFGYFPNEKLLFSFGIGFTGAGLWESLGSPGDAF